MADLDHLETPPADEPMPPPPEGDDIPREVKAAFYAVLAVGVLMFLGFALFRVVVPLILEAHFTGSVFAASAVGLFGTLGLGLIAAKLFGRIARLMKS